jgi:hypothetical protein
MLIGPTGAPSERPMRMSRNARSIAPTPLPAFHTLFRNPETWQS